LPQEFDAPDYSFLDDGSNEIQLRKDKRLAETNPQAYCADRCVSTGECEIFEDMFEMSPEEVMEFCKGCVLSDGEEPCDIPEAMFNDQNLKP